MALLRATAVALLLLLTVLVGAPLQLLLARLRAPAAAALLPRLFCRGMLALLGVAVDCPARPGGTAARLLVANHVSWLDVLVLGSLEPLSFLAKAEVANWPVFGTLARVNATVFVDRTRRRSIPGANRAMAAQLGAGRSVLLFPEGTTHDGSRRGRFLTSHLACLRDVAAESRGPAQVQAVALGFSHPAAAWVGDATLLPHVWTVLRRGDLTCRVIYGPPADVPAGADRKVLGRRLADEIEALLTREDAAARMAEVPVEGHGWAAQTV